MAITFHAVQNDNFLDAVTTISVAYNGNNLAHSCLVAYSPCLASGTIPPPLSISDTNNTPGGAVWIQATRIDLGTPSFRTCVAWVLPNCKAGANTVTLNYTGSGTTDFGLAVMEFTGVDTVQPLDGLVAQSTGSGNSTGTLTIPAVTPTVANSVIVAYAAPEQGTITPGSGWSDSDDNNHLQSMYKILTSSSTQTPTWTTTTSDFWAACALTLVAPRVTTGGLSTQQQRRVFSIPPRVRSFGSVGPTPPVSGSILNAPLFGTEA